MAVKVSATLNFDFSQVVGEMRAAAGVAVRAGVEAGSAGLQQDLRREIAAAGLSPKIGNMIGRRTFPDRKPGSLAAAADLFARGESAERLLEGFRLGATIVPGHGQFLAIPTRSNYRFGRGGGAVVTPADLLASKRSYVLPSRANPGNRVWFLRLAAGDVAVTRKGKRRLTLVRADIVRGGLATTRKQRAERRVAMFVLVRRAKLRRAFDVEARARDWADRIPGLIEAALPPGGGLS